MEMTNKYDERMDSTYSSQVTVDFLSECDNEEETSLKRPLLFDQHDSSSDLEDHKIVHLPPGKRFHLFVSHSSDDVTEVNELRKELYAKFGLTCLNYESDFKGGRKLETCVREGIEKCVKVLVMLSPSFLQSYWCECELHESLEKASKLEDESMIIPVILHPTPTKKIPMILKPYLCIDAQNTENLAKLAAKIHEAYNFSAKKKENLFPSYTYEDILKQNGARLISKTSENLEPFIRGGNINRFSSLDDGDKDILDSSNVNVNDHYKAVQAKLNDFWFIRRYKVFIGGCILWGFSFFIGLIACFSSLALKSLIIIIRQETLNVSASIGVPIAVGCFVWISVNIAIRICRIMMVRRLRRLIFKVNINFVDTSKCLIVFDNSVLAKPTLRVIRYDVAPCKEYLKILLDRRYFEENEDDRWDMANDKIKCKLKELQVKGQLTRWTSLPDQLPGDSNRHNMWEKKQCLCQMLEKEIIPVITDGSQIDKKDVMC